MADSLLLNEVTSGVARVVGRDCGLGKSVKFDFGADGVVFIDARSVPNVVDNIDRPADCTLKQSIADFLLMSEGKLDSTIAFLRGRLKIEGDLGIAMRLDSVLKS